MSTPSAPRCEPNHPVSYYWSGDVIRSRSVSDVVFFGAIALPALPARLVADWGRETSLRLCLQAGDVEELPLARSRARWPDYKHCVQAMADWMRTIGLPGVLDSCDVALMACRGANYHHDGAQYGDMAFCNLFLSEDRGQDLHFPSTGQRIPLTKGTVVLFDTCQPHAVIQRHSSRFDASDFPADLDCTQVFLSWELPIENARVGQALRIAYDLDPATAARLDDALVCIDYCAEANTPDVIS